MSHSKPIIVVPMSPQVARMLDPVSLRSELRASRAGVILIAPRAIRPAELMSTCALWPPLLRAAAVTRFAVVLGVEAYVAAKPVVQACRCKFAEHGIAVEYFHEAHLESDQIVAWFEQRRPRRRVSTDTLVKLAERYTTRGDARAAQSAIRIAEAEAIADTRVPRLPAARRLDAHTLVDVRAAARAAAATVLTSR